MDRNDKRNAVILFRQNPAKMSVPSMTMHQVGIDVWGFEINATAHCAESGAQRFWAGETARVELEPDDLEVAFFETLIAKATHFHRHRFRQFAREITHVHTRTAIDVRRILVCEEKNLHARLRSLYRRLCQAPNQRNRRFALTPDTLTSRAPAVRAHRPHGELCLQLRRKECH